MGFIHAYPYTSFHELNADWLLAKVKDIKDVETLKTQRRAVILGDSYLESAATNPTGAVDPITVATALLTDVARIQIVYGYGEGGTAFGTPYPSKYFDKMVTDSVLHVDDPEVVTDVIIMGGFNDRNNTVADIKAGMLRTKNAVKQCYPNAVLSVGFIGWSATLSDDDRGYLVNTALRSWHEGCNEHGIAFMANSEYIMHNYSYFYTDYVHPNQAGCNAIAGQIVQYLISGTCDVHYKYTEVEMSPGDAMTTDYNVGFRLDNDTVSIYMPVTTFEFNNPQTLSGNSWTQLIQITQLRSGYAISNFGDAYGAKTHFKLQGYAMRSDNTFISLEGWDFVLKGGFLWGRPMNIKSDGSGFDDFSNITLIRITGGELMTPTINC